MTYFPLNSRSCWDVPRDFRNDEDVELDTIALSSIMAERELEDVHDLLLRFECVTLLAGACSVQWECEDGMLRASSSRPLTSRTSAPKPLLAISPARDEEDRFIGYNVTAYDAQGTFSIDVHRLIANENSKPLEMLYALTQIARTYREFILYNHPRQDGPYAFLGTDHRGWERLWSAIEGLGADTSFDSGTMIAPNPWRNASDLVEYNKPIPDNDSAFEGEHPRILQMGMAANSTPAVPHLRLEAHAVPLDIVDPDDIEAMRDALQFGLRNDAFEPGSFPYNDHPALVNLDRGPSDYGSFRWPVQKRKMAA